MGSVMDIWGSPARLRHPRDVAVVGQLAQADPAQAELPVDGAGTAAATTPGVAPRLVLGSPLLADAL
jgi:hypothetical protein